MKAIQDLRMEHDAVRLTLKVLDVLLRRSNGKAHWTTLSTWISCLSFSRYLSTNAITERRKNSFFLRWSGSVSRGTTDPSESCSESMNWGVNACRKMKAAFPGIKAGEPLAAKNFVSVAHDYISLLNQHIDKENNVLFPMAERQLSEATLTELSNGFDRIEEQKIGVGKHEEFHKMIDQLESAYLK